MKKLKEENAKIKEAWRPKEDMTLSPRERSVIRKERQKNILSWLGNENKAKRLGGEDYTKTHLTIEEEELIASGHIGWGAATCDSYMTLK
jgi:hypothetical protein